MSKYVRGCLCTLGPFLSHYLTLFACYVLQRNTVALVAQQMDDVFASEENVSILIQCV